MERLDRDSALNLLPDRPPEGHKGNFGKLLLLCGSLGYTGAAYLAAMGALRGGAGLVYLGVPSCIYAIEAVKLNEAIVFPLPEDGGTLSDSAGKDIARRLPNMDAVLIGPGLGKSSGTLAALKLVLERAECPVVVDADGINLLAEHKYLLRGRTAPTVLTPHEGELSRLNVDLSGDRAAGAMAAARELGCVLVRKGKGTLITDGTRCVYNDTGNPGMAVGGCGDVLAGLITALLGQGIPPLEAAACGCYFHGAAGDLCARELGQYGMLPTDMLEALPRLLK